MDFSVPLHLTVGILRVGKESSETVCIVSICSRSFSLMYWVAWPLSIYWFSSSNYIVAWASGRNSSLSISKKKELFSEILHLPDSTSLVVLSVIEKIRLRWSTWRMYHFLIRERNNGYYSYPSMTHSAR